MAKAETAVTEAKFAIAYFSSQISAVENKDLEINLQQDPENEKKTLTCKTANGIQWVGRRDASLLRSTRLVLLARDRRTGQVSVAAATAEAFRFLPVCVIDAADAAGGNNKRKRPAPATPSTPQQRATAMYEEFGSTAKKRRIAEAKRLNASVSARDLKAVAATAAKRLERAAIKGGAPAAAATPAAAAAAAADQLLPPRDPSGFYASDALCPPRLRAALLPEAERLAASGPDQWAAWQAEAAFSYSDALILQRLRTAPADPAARLSYCVRLAMLACMRRFYALNYKAVNRKGALPDMPEDVARHLLDNYTEKVTTSTGQHRALTHQVKDKQLLHMIILCLQIDGHSTETAGLMTEFRLASGRLQKLLKVIGCDLVAEKSGGKIARLKVAPRA